MEDRSWKWTDAHFCSLPSQTNIYGCSKIVGSGMSKKLLVASLVGKFYTIEYQRIFDKLTPSTKELQFTYIPGEAEIVSVDAFTARGLIIGITFWKVEENESKQFLNIYSASHLGEEFNLETVAQGCQSIELQFVPYILTHAQCIIDGQEETVFLLSGSDMKIHLYREINGQHSFIEEDVNTYFPELTHTNSCVIWLDIVYIDNLRQRVTACGHQSGIVTVAVVDVTSSEILASYSVDHDSPITYVKIFSLTNRATKPTFLERSDSSSCKDGTRSPELHLLVLSALLPATVYRDVLTGGVTEPVHLLESNRYDTVLCGCVIDVDFDGENEILIGTYGQEILAYKLSSSHKIVRSHTADLTNVERQSESEKPRHHSGEAELSTTPRNNKRIPSRRVKSQENLSSSFTSEPDFILLSSSKGALLSERKISVPQDGLTDCRLVWQRSFAYPVIGMNRLDIMDDGMEDLIVVTLRGIHILQPDMNEVSSVCLERLRMLTDTCHTHTAVTENDGSDTHNTQELLNTESLSSLQTAIGSALHPAKWELDN